MNPLLFFFVFFRFFSGAARGTLGSMDFPEELANPDLVGALVKVSIICKENPRNPKLLALELASKCPSHSSRRCFLSRRDTSPRDRLGVLSSGQSFPTSTSLLCVHYRHRVRLAAASSASASRGDWNTSTSLPVIPRAAARAEQKARLIQDRFAPGNMRHSFASQPQIYSLSSSSVLNVWASKLFTASRYVYVCVFCAFATLNFGVYY